MEKREIIAKLFDLIRIDIGAVMAYEQATREIAEANVAEVLEAFQDDHEQHIHDLSAAILYYGGTPPHLAKDFRGFWLEGMTVIAAEAGTHAALLAMHQNEALTIKTYKEILAGDLPPEARDIIERNYEDEQRHFAFINHALADRLWESPVRLTSLATEQSPDAVPGDSQLY